MLPLMLFLNALHFSNIKMCLIENHEELKNQWETNLLRSIYFGIFFLMFDDYFQACMSNNTWTIKLYISLLF